MKSELMDQLHEEFWLLLLKRNNEVIKKVQVSKGGVSGTVVDPKIIFKFALDELAMAFLGFHSSFFHRHVTTRQREARQAFHMLAFKHVVVDGALLLVRRDGLFSGIVG